MEWLPANWLPMLKNHSNVMLAQLAVGLSFTALYFIRLKFLIEKYDVKTPGREADDEEAKLYTKEDLKQSRERNLQKLMILMQNKYGLSYKLLEEQKI